MSIPTAVEFIQNFTEDPNDDTIFEAMIEFTKLHLKAQARAIEETGISNITTWYGNPYSGEGSESLDLEKILNVYPLDNIK